MGLYVSGSSGGGNAITDLTQDVLATGPGAVPATVEDVTGHPLSGGFYGSAWYARSAMYALGSQWQASIGGSNPASSLAMMSADFQPYNGIAELYIGAPIFNYATNPLRTAIHARYGTRVYRDDGGYPTEWLATGTDLGAGINVMLAGLALGKVRTVASGQTVQLDPYSSQASDLLVEVDFSAGAGGTVILPQYPAPDGGGGRGPGGSGRIIFITNPKDTISGAAKLTVDPGSRTIAGVAGPQQYGNQHFQGIFILDSTGNNWTLLDCTA